VERGQPPGDGKRRDYIVGVANEALLKPDSQEQLVAFGRSGMAEFWSGISYNDRDGVDASLVTVGADFTCFMFRPETIRTFRWFDTNSKPAYFEDNDYCARVVLGRGAARVVHAAQFYHHGSMTIRVDPIAAHHVRHRFALNRQYFSRKWGEAPGEKGGPYIAVTRAGRYTQLLARLTVLGAIVRKLFEAGDKAKT
jgi:GT2 family glycosyltransferase